MKNIVVDIKNSIGFITNQTVKNSLSKLKDKIEKNTYSSDTKDMRNLEEFLINS